MENMSLGGGKGPTDQKGSWINGEWVVSAVTWEDRIEKAITQEEQLNQCGQCLGGCFGLIWNSPSHMNPKETGQIMQLQGQWEKITMTADSGAVDHVIKTGELSSVNMRPSFASENGLTYAAANGSSIANYGEKPVNGVSNEGHGVDMVLQVADVKRNLASIPKMLNDGNRVILDQEGSYIQNKASGQKINMRIEKDGLFEFDVWVKKLQEVAAPIKNRIPFTTDEQRKEDESTFRRLVMNMI